MARITPRPTPTPTQTLQSLLRHCPCCGDPMWAAYHNDRTITTLTEVLPLTRQIRRCLPPTCPQFRRPYRPEAEGRRALPKHAFGLDVVTRAGTWRSAPHRSLPDMHQALGRRRVAIAPRTVHHLVERYEALVALSLSDTTRLQALNDLAAWIRQVTRALPVPTVGVISDGQRSIRAAVRPALPAGPHQLCHCHYLREAAKPIYAADRHAKKALTKPLRGVRPIDRHITGRHDAQARVRRAYCQAVHSALTDDGRPSLDAAGRKLHARLTAIAESLARVAKKGCCPRH